MNIRKHKPEIYFIAAFLILVGLAAVFIAVSAQGGGDKVKGDIYFQGESLKGKTYSQARSVIDSKIQSFYKNGVTISHARESAVLYPDIGSLESGVVQDNFSLSTSKTIDNLKRLDNRRWIFSRGQAKELPAAYEINEKNIEDEIATNFNNLSIPAQDATFYQDKGSIMISQEKIGQAIYMAGAIEQIRNRLEKLDETPVTLETVTAYPKISRQDLLMLADQASGFAGKKLSLTNGNKRWSVSSQTILSWISVSKSSGQTALDIDPERIATYLEKYVVPEVNYSPEMPRFEVSGDKISSWQLGKDGLEVDMSSTTQEIREAVLDSSYSDIAIVTKTVPAEKMDSANGLSIKEILGTGHSSFAGSPSNRRHNIEVGANSLQGLLIKPDEEFSLIKALGSIDAENGYLPELVIKENKTVPEYGGGLCQIGTTVFRAALASGLPITERRNHSYRVSYYEPAGTDATIYDPSPDFKFKNDTGNYILIQSRIKGDDIYFDFWGTSDGREATTTYPVIYNIVKPDPTKIIYTTDLKPGEKKCTESSHNGADAYFDYTVTYPATSTDAEPVIKERRFSSHYVPWQGVCLVGTTTLEIATSSEAVTASTTTEQ